MAGHGAVRQPRVSQPPARAPSPPTAAPRGGLVCLVGRPQPPAEHNPAQVRRPTLPRWPPHDLRSGARIDASSGRRPSRRGRGRTTWSATRSSRDRCPAVPGVPHRYHWLTRDETDATRADGWTTDGWTTDGWTLDGLDTSRADTSRPDAGRPDAGRAGHQPAGRRTGWTPAGRTPDGLDTGRAGHRTGWTPGSPTVDRPAGALAHCCPRTIAGRA
jgi:hypothetical protein